MSKANKDGWVRHRGGKQPVGDDVRVEYRLRSGANLKELAGNLDWSHEDNRGDIMAFRICAEPESILDNPGEPTEALKEILELDAPVTKQEGPIAWRDRIHEIDAKTKAMAQERADLIQKLATEGFALIDKAEPNNQEESAQAVDMSDPENWRAGDLFEIIGEDSHNFVVGETVRMTVFESDHDREDGHQYEHLDSRDFWWVKDVNVKFHSRPTT